MALISTQHISNLAQYLGAPLGKITKNGQVSLQINIFDQLLYKEKFTFSCLFERATQQQLE